LIQIRGPDSTKKSPAGAHPAPVKNQGGEQLPGATKNYYDDRRFDRLGSAFERGAQARIS
jgi:hypothetical protein